MISSCTLSYHSGFNWPNRHMKKLGCMDEIVEWGNDPDHKAPVDPGHKALTLYVLSLYPQRREYMWKLKEYDCNPDHELGTCNNTATGEVTFGHCKAICQNDPFCAGFNVPNGHLKSAGCRTDTFSTKHKVPEWGQTLYIIQPTPQRRNTSWKTWAEHKGKDCAPGFELGNCSQCVGCGLCTLFSLVSLVLFPFSLTHSLNLHTPLIRITRLHFERRYLPPPYSESECKSACEKNPYCGGFNLPFGHLKTVDCTQEVAPDAKDKSITLYTLTTTK